MSIQEISIWPNVVTGRQRLISKQRERDIYLPHGWFLFLVVQGQWGFPVAHCLTGSDLSAHLQTKTTFNFDIWRFLQM